MKTTDQIKAIIDNHTQMRSTTCFQLAVEMVLKLYEIIDADSYPEQAIVENDARGFEPFKENKAYGETTVSFTETKYDPISVKAVDDCVQLLKEGVFPILSFAWNNDFHSAIAFTDPDGKIAFITKEAIGKRYTNIWSLADIWPQQRKTETLAVRRI